MIESSTIPEGWSQVPLEGCVEILDHMRVPVNSDERYGRQGLVPYYGANGLQGYIDKAIFNEPLILMAEDGGFFDEYATRPIAYKIDGPSWVNNHAHVLRPKDGHVLDYLFAQLVHKDIRRYILGGTRAKLNQSELRRIQVLRAPLDEQRRIAAILDVSEATIRATEAVIEKLRLERKGIVLRLMAEAEGTERITLGALLDRDGGTIQTGPFGSQLHSWEYQREGIPVVMPQDIDLEWDHISPEKVARISQRRANDLSRHAMAPGDIVFARRGDLIRAATIAESRRGWLCGTGCFLLRTVGVAINPKWLVMAYRSPTVQRQVSIEATGTTMPNLNGTIMRGLRLTVPKRDRQDQVVQIIEAATTGINSEQDKLDKLRLQHQGLLHDLLTGTVRTHA